MFHNVTKIIRKGVIVILMIISWQVSPAFSQNASSSSRVAVSACNRTDNTIEFSAVVRSNGDVQKIQHQTIVPQACYHMFSLRGSRGITISNFEFYDQSRTVHCKHISKRGESRTFDRNYLIYYSSSACHVHSA